jgi:CRP-like cAMP-binding protein
VLSAEDYFDVLEDNFEYARAGVEGVAANLHQLSLDLAPTGGFPEPPRALPPPERPLDLVERTLVLHAAPAFHAARVQGVTRLAGLAEELRFAPGDVIARRGDPCDALLVVAYGLVQVSREDPRMEALFGAGSIVSGSATLSHNAHEYDTVAVAPTAALRVRKADFFDLLEDHFDVTRAILAFLGGERERIYAEQAARTKVEEHSPRRWSLATPDAARDIEAISQRLSRV